MSAALPLRSGSSVLYLDGTTGSRYEVGYYTTCCEGKPMAETFWVRAHALGRLSEATRVQVMRNAALAATAKDITAVLARWQYEALEKRLSGEALDHIQDCYADWRSKL